jgi:hypothetical protein
VKILKLTGEHEPGLRKADKISGNNMNRRFTPQSSSKVSFVGTIPGF